MKSQVIFGLYDSLSLEHVGKKFLMLSDLAKHYLIPPAICLGTNAFIAALSAQQDILVHVSTLYDHLYQSRGYQLEKHISGFSPYLSQIEIPAEIIAELSNQIQDKLQFPVIVRSSAVSEDQDEYSHAGIYESYPNITNLSTLINAIKKCWASYYSYRAITYRLLTNQSESSPQMAVIVQRMVKGAWSGVVFSRSPMPIQLTSISSETLGYVEYSPDTNENIVGGIRSGGSALFDNSDGAIRFSKDVDIPPSAITAVTLACEISKRLERELNKPVDVEWTWTHESGLWLLQVRGIKSDDTISSALKVPAFKLVDLYEIPLDPGIDLQNCFPIYLHWSKKRGPIRQRASAAGILLGGVAALEINLKGALDIDYNDHPALNRLGASQLIIDAGAHLRQLVIFRNELKTCIAELLRAGSRDLWTKRTFLLREYIVGSGGLLSTIDADANVIVEFAPQPLPSLTRGFAKTWLFSISTDNQITCYEYHLWTDVALNLLQEIRPKVADIANFTRSEAQHHPSICLEWVIEKGQLILVDASILPGDEKISVLTDYRCLSKGFAQGKILKIGMDNWQILFSNSAAISLSEESDDPLKRDSYAQQLLDKVNHQDSDVIVVAPHPQAALAILLGRVKGFIFEEGPQLCHLAILLREQRIPAIFSRQAYQELNDGQEVILSNGQLFIL